MIGAPPRRDDGGGTDGRTLRGGGEDGTVTAGIDGRDPFEVGIGIGIDGGAGAGWSANGWSFSHDGWRDTDGRFGCIHGAFVSETARGDAAPNAGAGV